MDIDYDKMWKELIEQIKEDEQQEGEMSISDFSKMTGFSLRQSRTRLEQLEKAGLVTKRLGSRKKCKLFLYKPSTS